MEEYLKSLTKDWLKSSVLKSAIEDKLVEIIDYEDIAEAILSEYDIGELIVEAAKELLDSDLPY